MNLQAISLPPVQLGFSAGTPVHTPQGLRAIEDLRPGDWVLSRDTASGPTRPQRISGVVTHPSAEVVELRYRTEGSQAIERLITSARQKFRHLDGGWLPAEKLRGQLDLEDKPTSDEELRLPARMHLETIDATRVNSLGTLTIYVSDYPDIGWTPTVHDELGTLTNYRTGEVINRQAWCIESISTGEHADPHFKKPLHQLFIEGTHSFFVGANGLWTRDASGHPGAPSGLARGSLVLTANGPRPIEALTDQDWVLAMPEGGGAPELRRVLGVSTWPAEQVVRIDMPQHKHGDAVGSMVSETVSLQQTFWLQEQGWTTAAELFDHGRCKVHFLGATGEVIDFWKAKRIYWGGSPHTGWICTSSSDDIWGRGALWDFDQGQRLAWNVDAPDDVRNERIPDPYLKLPVYTLRIDGGSTCYVGQHGMWAYMSGA